MKYNININLSPQGILPATQFLDKLANHMDEISDEFLKLSLNYLEEKAKEYIDATTGNSDWYEVTGNLKNSFRQEMGKFYGELINYASYALFVENGTGIYELEGQGRQGGWVFYSEQDRQFHFTEGMLPHRFVYNAYQDYITTKKYGELFDIACAKYLGGT